MVKISEVSQLVRNWANDDSDNPQLVDFTMFIYDGFRDEENLDELNLPYAWRQFLGLAI